jgi:hypothetical protein
MQDAPRRCLLVPPPGANKTLKLTFKDLALTDKLTLRVGLDLRGARNEGLDVTWRALLGGEQVAQGTVIGHQDGWPETSIDTKRWSSQPTSLVIELSAAEAKQRHICLDGWIWSQR